MLTFQRMTQSEFETYSAASMKTYAQEKVRAEGLSAADAERAAKQSFERLLPQGIATDGQNVFHVVENGTEARVGIAWFGLRDEGAKRISYIYDIELKPEHQGKGYGRETMKMIEQESRRLGAKKLGLHVFGHNTRARGLYESLGFVTTNIYMWKEF